MRGEVGEWEGEIWTQCSEVSAREPVSRCGRMGAREDMGSASFGTLAAAVAAAAAASKFYCYCDAPPSRSRAAQECFTFYKIFLGGMIH